MGMARSSDTELAAPPSASPAESAGENERANPYVGPRSLRYGEHIYGRDREARQLLELLIAERIVLLYSPSGAGKTSLIQAALIPELEKEEFHVLPIIRVGRGAGENVYPCNPYIFSALLSMEQGVPPEHAIPAAELAPMQLGEYLRRREEREDSGDGMFLIFDQFEEILTLDAMNREAKIDFFNQVGEALRDLKRWALFAMREDHVAALDPYLRPIPTRLKSTFRLDLLNAECARVAVQRPARECGVEFTEGATTKLVDDLREVAVQGPTGATEMQLGPYIEPVQLQVVCYRLWEKLPPNVSEITEAQVVGSGDVDSALADYYSERVAQIAAKCSVKERVLREWFDRRLITENGIRSQVMVGSENGREISESAIQELVNVHLIRGEERRGVTWLELAHDRLVKPIRANNAAWWERNLSVLQHQAAVWSNQGKSDALCLRGEARKEAQRWADAHAEELTETEREFLEVCQRNHDARTNKWAVWALTIVTLVLGGISLLTVYAWNQAAMAKRERDVATARSIAARAMQLRDDRLDVALLLSTEAQRLSDQPDTRGSLLAAAYHNPRLTTYLNGSPSPIGAVAFSQDLQQVATGDFDGRVTLWDLKTHRQIETLPKLVKDAVRTIAYSGDGRWMAISSKDTTIVMRDLRTGKVRPLPPELSHNGDVWSVAFSEDSSLFVSGDSTGEINVWELAGETVTTLPKINSDVRAVAFDPAAKMLAVGTGDGEIMLWARDGSAWNSIPVKFAADHPDDPEKDARRLEDNVKLDSRRKDVRQLAISPDGQSLAAGRRSGVVDLYSISELPPVVKVAAFGRHDGAVSGLAFSPGKDGSQTRKDVLVTSGFDGTLRLWKVPTMEPVGPPFTGHVGRVFAVAFSHDRRTVVSGGADRRAILWDTWKHVAQTGRAEAIDVGFSVSFSPDGTREANGYASGAVKLLTRDLAKWPAYSEVTLIADSDRAGRVPITAFSGDSRWLATCAGDAKLRVHDLASIGADGVPAVVAEFEPTGGVRGRRVTSLSISHDGSKVAASVSQEDVTAQVFAWSVATRAPLFPKPLSHLRDDVMFALEFSPDGKRLVSGGDGERAVVWNLGGGAQPDPLACVEEHTGTIRSIAFSPDGKTFATTSGDNTLIVWDTETRKRLSAPLAGHHAPVVVAAFSPDGRILASGSDDHSVILWDVATRQSTGRLIGHTDSVRALAFSSDSKRLYTGSWGDESREWELDPGALQNICRERANRNLVESEWTDYMLSGPFRLTWPKLAEPLK